MARKAIKRGLTMVQISRMKKSASSTVHMPQIIKDRLALLRPPTFWTRGK